MASGEITITIRLNSRRFRLQLSRARLSMAWWNLKAAGSRGWDAMLAWARPGLAPELANWQGCPWLSRTAGRLVTRPIPLNVFLARITGDVRIFAEVFQQMERASRQATEAFLEFGRAWGAVKLRGA